MPTDSVRWVMWSITPESSGPGPYVENIVRELRDKGWSVDGLSILRLLRSRKGIVHIQWPEHVSRGPTRTKTLLKHARALALLAAVKMRGHHLVLTAHNLEPHGYTDRYDSWFRRRVEKNADAVVVLVPDHAEVVRQRLGAAAAPPMIAFAPNPVNNVLPRPIDRHGHLLVLGLIDRYHLVEEFVEALVTLGNERDVTIVGRPGEPALVARLLSRADGLPWLRVHPEYIEGDRLDELVESAAGLVALQRMPFNTGGPFFALPRGLPVVMSESDLAAMLSGCVGPDWIFPVPADLKSIDLDALEAWLVADRSQPDLRSLSASLVADRHIELYESLLD